MARINFLDKCVLELRRAAQIKVRLIEFSASFLLEHNGQTQVYRLVGCGEIAIFKQRMMIAPPLVYQGFV